MNPKIENGGAADEEKTLNGDQNGLTENILDELRPVIDDVETAIIQAETVDDVVKKLELTDEQQESARKYLGMTRKQWSKFTKLSFRPKDAVASGMLMFNFIAIIILLSIFTSIKEGCTPTENAIRFAIAFIGFGTLGFGFLYVLSLIKERADKADAQFAESIVSGSEEKDFTNETD